MKKLLVLTYFLLLLVIHAQKANIPKEMVYVKGGFYTPLYINDADSKKVKVEPFLMDKYPVTNQEFLEFVKEFPAWRKSNVKKIFADESYLSNWKSDLELGKSLNPNSPVVNVSWFAAKEYAKWKGKRLPSVAEWEIAAMADKNNPDGYSNPNFVNLILKWYSKPSTQFIAPVGSVYNNYYGLHDMHGLIWEWTDDFFNALVSGESRGDNGINRNLFCGSGSVGATDYTNYPAFMRFAFRSSLKASYTTSNLGFRCVKNYNKE